MTSRFRRHHQHPRMSRGRRGLAAAAAVLAAAAAALAAAPATAAAAAAGGPARPASAAASTAAGGGLLTDGQALARARATGKPVPVPGATTPSSTLTAEPDGRLTLTQTSEPVRKWAGGKWLPLNAALHRNSDGSVSPTVTTSALRLSGGGTGPLAVMSDDGASLALTLPVRLPAPVLSGDSATYADVLPGVDLKVTAGNQGGFSEVLIVRDAAAAQDPALRSLTFRTAVTGGLTLRADAAGNLTAATKGGNVLFSAPAPRMWDSTAEAAGQPAVTDPATGQQVDKRTGQPLASSPAGPGEAARTAKVGVRAGHGSLTLVPDTALLDGTATRYPVYIDPTYAAGGTEQDWTMVNSAFPTTSYWRTSGLLQVGYNGWSSPYFTARSFVRESVPSTLYTAAIYSSTVYFTDEWAPSCDTSLGNFGVQVWQTGSISSSTTWDSQPGWTADEANKTFAHGYDSSCPAASEGFNVTSLMKTAAAGQWPNVTLGLRAASETDAYGWKQFSNVVTMTTTYDHPPATPASLTTSPDTSCQASPPDTVGNGDVTLYAGVSDPDGGSLSATFTSYNTSSGATLDNATVTATSGTTAALRINQTVLDAAAGTSVTEFSWNVKVSDGTLSSGTSVTCHFKFDPSAPGQPSVTCTTSCSYVIGTPSGFTVTHNTADTVLPASYSWQLNGAAPVTVAANSSGNATVTVTPDSGTDILTVTAVSAGGNIGDPASVIFNANLPKPAADGDLTGDGIPDLLTPGGSGTGLPAGLWLARGEAGPSLTTGDGQVSSAGLDIGAEGDGITPGSYSPSDFTGSKVVTGTFNGKGFQDTLVYYPSGTYAGTGAILDGTGNGSVLESENTSTTTGLSSSTFTTTDPCGTSPLQVVNGYHAVGDTGGNFPDLVTVSGTNIKNKQCPTPPGYYLEYYLTGNSPGIYSYSFKLTTLTPDGTMDWNNWTIATMLESTGTGTGSMVDMFLYDASTGALWLWRNFTVGYSGTVTKTAYQLSASWNPGTLSELRAADITGTGPAVWAVTTSGTVTAWTVDVNSTAGTATITAGAAQTLLGPTHNWRLGDHSSGAISSATDTGSGPTFSLTGSSDGATWTTGGLFSPAADFNGSNGYMTGTSGIGAITATSDYTVSAWIKPNSIAGVPFAESDQSTGESCMALYLDKTTNSSGQTYGRWNFETTSANSTSRVQTVATTGSTNPVHVGSWTHIAVTYSAASKYMEIYVDGIPAASAQPSSVWSSGCTSFELAHYFDQGHLHAYFPGEIADVQTWLGTVLTPTEIADLSGTPGYDLFPSDSHQYASASSPTDYQWTTACADMGFYQGKLTIKETCSGNSTVTYGPGGYPNAVLTLQTDGNLVIYDNAADATAADTGALWDSGTWGNPGDTMFFQPDGNLVIYGTYGNPLWSTHTHN